MKINCGGEGPFLEGEKKWYGGLPDGMESSEEVLMLFEEVEETGSNIDHVRAIFNEQIGHLSLGGLMA